MSWYTWGTLSDRELEERKKEAERRKAEFELNRARKMSEQTKAVLMALFLGLCAYLARIEKILGENPLLPWSLPDLYRQKNKIELMFEMVIYDWTSEHIGRKFRRELKTLHRMILKVFNDLPDVQQVWTEISDQTRETIVEERSRIVELLELINSPIENPVPAIESEVGRLRAVLSDLETQIEQKQLLINPNQRNDELINKIHHYYNLKHDLMFQIGELIKEQPHEEEMYQKKLSDLKTDRSELIDLILKSQKWFLEIVSPFRERRKEKEEAQRESQRRDFQIRETEKTIKNCQEELAKMEERLSTLEQCRMSLREEYTALFLKSSSDPQLENFEKSLNDKTSVIIQLRTDIERLRGKIEMNFNSLRVLQEKQTPQ